MCHEPSAVPPNFGEGAAAFEQQDLVLRSADGTEFSAYLATPVAISTIPRTRPGATAANTCASMPPKECPAT